MVKQVILCSFPMWAVCQVAVKLPWKNYVCCIKRLDTDEVLMILPAFDEMILQPFLLHPVHPNVSHCWHSGVGCMVVTYALLLVASHSPGLLQEFYQKSTSEVV